MIRPVITYLLSFHFFIESKENLSNLFFFLRSLGQNCILVHLIVSISWSLLLSLRLNFRKLHSTDSKFKICRTQFLEPTKHTWSPSNHANVQKRVSSFQEQSKDPAMRCSFSPLIAASIIPNSELRWYFSLWMQAEIFTLHFFLQLSLLLSLTQNVTHSIEFQ